MAYMGKKMPFLPLNCENRLNIRFFFRNIWSVCPAAVILHRFSAHNMTNCVSDFFDAFFCGCAGSILSSLKCLQ